MRSSNKVTSDNRCYLALFLWRFAQIPVEKDFKYI